jgi:hypothetical protein
MSMMSRSKVQVQRSKSKLDEGIKVKYCRFQIELEFLGTSACSRSTVQDSDTIYGYLYQSRSNIKKYIGWKVKECKSSKIQRSQSLKGIQRVERSTNPKVLGVEHKIYQYLETTNHSESTS